MTPNIEQPFSYQPEEDDDFEFIASSEDFKPSKDSYYSNAEEIYDKRIKEDVAGLFNDIRINGGVGMQIRDQMPQGVSIDGAGSDGQMDTYSSNNNDELETNIEKGSDTISTEDTNARQSDNMPTPEKNKQDRNPVEINRPAPAKEPISSIEGDTEIHYTELQELLNQSGSVVFRGGAESADDKITWFTDLYLHESGDGEHLLRIQPSKEKRVFKDNQDKTVTEKVGPAYYVYADLFFEEYLADEVLFLAPGDTPSDIGLDDTNASFMVEQIPEELRVVGYKSATELVSESYRGLVKDSDGVVWQISEIHEEAAVPHAKLSKVGRGETVKVPLVNADDKKFAERYSPITDPKKAEEIVNADSSDVNGKMPDKAKRGMQDKEGKKGSVEYDVKQPDESLFSYAYNRVNDEQRELLKQIQKELADSEYEGIKRLQGKLANSPAEVLRAISGIEGGEARQDEFPKYEILQTLGAIERINGEVVSKESVRNMVAAGYDSEWDVWQRVKANHVYERQDGTLLVNLSGSRHGLWSKFENEQAYEACVDPQKDENPIGRKRGIGGMLEYIAEDIDTVQSEAADQSGEQSKEEAEQNIDVGSMVKLFEEGTARWSEYHAVEDIIKNNDGELLIRTDKGSAYWPVEKFKIKESQETKADTAEQAASQKIEELNQSESMLTKKDIRDVIYDANSVDQAVDTVLNQEKFFWNQDQHVIKEGEKWVIYNKTTEDKVNEFSRTEIEQAVRRNIIEMNEKNKHKIDNFVDNVVKSVNKIAAALPEGESSQDEERFKHEFQQFRNNLVANNKLLSKQEVTGYRDRFVQFMHYYKNERPDIWRDSKAVYRPDVIEVVKGVEQVLENSK
jgi:hypothetical protein